MAQVHQGLCQRKPGILGEMQQAHLVVGEVLVARELLVHVAEAAHALVAQLEGADGADAGHAPHLPAGVDRGAQLRVGDGGHGLEDAVADHQYARRRSGLDEPVDVAAAHRRAQLNAILQQNRAFHAVGRRPGEQGDLSHRP